MVITTLYQSDLLHAYDRFPSPYHLKFNDISSSTNKSLPAISERLHHADKVRVRIRLFPGNCMLTPCSADPVTLQDATYSTENK